MTPAEKLLRDVMAEIEEAVMVPSYSDRVEIDPATARRLLARYARLQKKPVLNANR